MKLIDNYINKIINADCLDILKELPDKCIDLVLTDPPYGIFTKDKIANGGTWAKKYNNQSEKWDFAPSEKVFNEIFRVSKNQIIFGANYFRYEFSNFIVWKKHIPENFSMGMCEIASNSCKGNSKIYEYSSSDSQRFHPTQKPVALFKKILSEFSQGNDLILDCFSGSGTTAIACHDLNRRFICIEKDKDYWQKSVERLENFKKQLSLF